MKKAYLSLILSFFSLISYGQWGSQIAQPDTIYASLGEVIIMNPTLNDIDTTGRPIQIDSVYSDNIEIISFNDSLITIKMLDFCIEKQRIYYKVVDTSTINNFGTSVLIYPKTTFDTLNSNDIKLTAFPSSIQFWDVFTNHNFDTDGEFMPQFYYPAHSLQSTYFNYGIWLGGKNVITDSLHVAGERYRQAGTDFWPGPLSIDGNVTTDSINAGKWMRTWKVSGDEIQYHLRNFNNPNYIMPEAIKSWPAHGDPELNQAEFLAPFVDVDLDREYHPEKGDYPLIKGDQSIFFIFNDQIEHGETKGMPIGIEVHCMAWAFDKNPEHEELNSTVFYSYKIFNRSLNDYNDFYFGAWSDFDIGYWADDYVGSNVQQGYYFGYNGRDYDQDHMFGNIVIPGYHEIIPTQGTCILGGPYMNNDEIDNLEGGCDEGINGVGFGDGIADNERFGMTFFKYFNNSGPSYFGDPQNALEYYQYLCGKWKDNTPMVYGGNAHYTTGGDSLFPTRFMFPGESDPCNWGTNGLEPSWDTIWTEETTGNMPNDRRGLGSTGPFTFEAGSVEYLDIALVTAPGDQGVDSKELLEEYVEAIRAEYLKNPEEFGNQYLGAEDLAFEPNESISIFPNPTKGDLLYINLPKEQKAIYHIYNSTSQLVSQGFLLAQKQQEIDISDLPSGWFVFEVIQNGKAYRTKLIRH